MIRYKAIKNILWVSLAILVSSCQRDVKDFGFEKLNTVSISPDSTFTVTQYDSLRFEPVYKETKPNGGKYKYEWLIYPVFSTTGGTVLSTERNLRVAIKQPPGSYSMQCRVTDLETGITAIKLYSMTINGRFYGGWMVSNNRNSTAHLDFIRTDDVMIFDGADTVNNTSYPGNGIAALSTNSGGIPIVLFFTDKGAYRFNGNDFFQNANTAKLFGEGKTFTSLPAYVINTLGSEQLVISDGGLYAGIGTGFGGTEAQVLTPFSDRYNGDYDLYPGLAPSSLTTTYVYDNKHKRFMQTAYGTRTLTPSTTSGSFDMGNVGMTAIGFDRGSSSGFYNTEYYFIMQDANNNRFVYSVNTNEPGIRQQFANSPEIGIAKHFASPTDLKQIYYATDSKIYLYDITANAAELLYTFPEGKIASIKVQQSGTSRLVAAVNRGTAGEVFYFDIDVRGRITNGTFAKKFTGFGEIVHISFKS